MVAALGINSFDVALKVQVGAIKEKFVMKKIFTLLAVAIFTFGCARVSLQAPKEPIKLDISMRLDIYQHVEKDIDAIEDLVSGGGAADKVAAPDKQSFLNSFVSIAYAEDGLSPEVEEAALRRKSRLGELRSLETSGAIGESNMGLVEIRDSSKAEGSINELIRMENSDRMIIYRSVAEKNGTTVEDVQKIYGKRLQNDAPSGTPIETDSGEWSVK